MLINYKNISKKTKMFIFGLLILLFLFVIYILNKNKKAADDQTNQVKPQISTYENLTLGKSSRNEIVNNIGLPNKEYFDNNKLHLEYTTLNPNFNDEFVLENERLTFIKKIIVINDKLRVGDLKSKYGNEEYILYGPGSSIGLKMFVYPSKGVAFIGFEGKGYLTEVWYFEPTNIEQFKTKFGLNYSDTPEEIQ